MLFLVFSVQLTHKAGSRTSLEPFFASMPMCRTLSGDQADQCGNARVFQWPPMPRILTVPEQKHCHSILAICRALRHRLLHDTCHLVPELCSCQAEDDELLHLHTCLNVVSINGRCKSRSSPVGLCACFIFTCQPHSLAAAYELRLRLTSSGDSTWTSSCHFGSDAFVACF